MAYGTDVGWFGMIVGRRGLFVEAFNNDLEGLSKEHEELNKELEPLNKESQELNKDSERHNIEPEGLNKELERLNKEHQRPRSVAQRSSATGNRRFLIAIDDPRDRAPTHRDARSAHSAARWGDNTGLCAHSTAQWTDKARSGASSTVRQASMPARCTNNTDRTPGNECAAPTDRPAWQVLVFNRQRHRTQGPMKAVNGTLCSTMVQRHGPIHLNHNRSFMMGANLPSDRRQSLEWLEGHVAGWNTNYASIGLTSAQVIDLAGDIANARQAFTTVTGSRAGAKADTQDWYAQADDLHTKAAGLVNTIKSFATTSGNSSAVYTAADMTPRSGPTPTPAPDQPTSVMATLQTNGSVTASWDGKGPSGTVYQIYRKLVSENDFSLIGSVGSNNKEFNDPTVPSGIASAMYQVRAQHGEKFSLFSASTSVIFGTAQGAGEAAAA